MNAYLLLGVIQGFTEFFPVSSSAHLVIMQHLLGMQDQAVLVSVVLHVGTAFSLVVFLFRDILEVLRNRRMLGLIVLTCAITALIGLAGKDFFERLFSSPRLAAAALFCTGIVLILTRTRMQGTRRQVYVRDAALLGVTQGIAIVPGISRSGITISTLLFRGITAHESLRFSFLVSLPVIFGAALLELKDAAHAGSSSPQGLAAGCAASFVAGLAALVLLKRILSKARFHYFGYYCIAVALATLAFIR